MNKLARTTLLTLLTAGALLLAGPAQAAGTGPTTAPGTHPTPAAQRVPPVAHATASRPAAARPAYRASAARPIAPAIRPAAAAATPEAAPRLVFVSGTIVGADGRPCPGACVFPTANPRLLAVADATGAFKLQVPAAAGPVRLQADYFGLGSRRVEVDSQHPQPLSIVLGH